MPESTTNYSIFKKHAHNRELVEGNVLKIMKSIQSKNLLEYRPILLDSDWTIIDGQHRLEACKRLGIPVFYEVKPNITKKDIILLNDNSQGWSRNDYLNFYCQEGNINYLKLKTFMQRTNLSLTLAFSVLGKDNSRNYGTRFNNGEFVYVTPEEEMHSLDILEKSVEILNYIQDKVQKQNYIFGPRFRRALYIFLSIRAIDFRLFMDKLAHRLDLLRPCARLCDFVDILKRIYNWRNRNPISLESDFIDGI